MTVTSPANPNALPDAWIDRLFQRLSLMYGNAWSQKWAGLPLADVKAAWATDLAFASADQIRRALDHCRANNPHPPSSPEFVGLCRAFAPAMDTRRALPNYAKEAMPPEVRAAIARVLEPGKKRDPKDWAREVLYLHEQGLYKYIIGVTNARRALGLEEGA